MRGMTLNVSIVTPENVTGLVVGEGCFYAESTADTKYKLGWRLRPGFCIEMRGDDRSVLEAVQHHLGCGAIYDLDFGRYRGYEARGWAPHAKYRVTALPDLEEKVLPFFRRHPLFGRKAEAFSLFAELVEHLRSGHHRSNKGLAVGKEIAARLAEHNARGGNPSGRR